MDVKQQRGVADSVDRPRDLRRDVRLRAARGSDVQADSPAGAGAARSLGQPAPRHRDPPRPPAAAEPVRGGSPARDGLRRERYSSLDQFRLGVAVSAAMLIAYSLATRAERAQAVWPGTPARGAGRHRVHGRRPRRRRRSRRNGAVLVSRLYIGVWTAGRLVRSREQMADQLAEKSLLLERQREETAALAAAERTRLASDLDAAARSHVRELIELAAAAEQSDRTGSGAYARHVRPHRADRTRDARRAARAARRAAQRRAGNARAETHAGWGLRHAARRGPRRRDAW